MSAESYFYLNENDEPCGPFTAEQMRAMALMGKLTPHTLASAGGSSDWAPLATLISLAPGGLPSNFKPIQPKSSKRRVGITLLVVLTVFAVPLGYGVWRWLPELKKLAGKEELMATPHALARWYLFGHFQGSQQAKMAAALGKTPKPSRADLAYTLKALGVPDPPPQHFAMCAQGFEDGMLNKPQRHVLEKDAGLDDAFPDALNGIFEFPVREKRMAVKGKP
jgi:hypothetical protein